STSLKVSEQPTHSWKVSRALERCLKTQVAGWPSSTWRDTRLNVIQLSKSYLATAKKNSRRWLLLSSLTKLIAISTGLCMANWLQVSETSTKSKNDSSPKTEESSGQILYVHS